MIARQGDVGGLGAGLAGVGSHTDRQAQKYLCVF